MTLLYATIPLMLLAIAVAVVPLVWAMRADAAERTATALGSGLAIADRRFGDDEEELPIAA